MKEPARAIHKRFRFNRGISSTKLNRTGSFKTIPNSFRQLPVKN